MAHDKINLTPSSFIGVVGQTEVSDIAYFYILVPGLPNEAVMHKWFLRGLYSSRHCMYGFNENGIILDAFLMRAYF